MIYDDFIVSQRAEWRILRLDINHESILHASNVYICALIFVLDQPEKPIQSMISSPQFSRRCLANS